MKRFSFSILGCLLALFPAVSHAQNPASYFDPGGNIQKNSGLPGNSLIDYVFNAINAALGVLSVVALVLILYAGFTILTSAGNEDKIKTGRQILVWSVIGLLIIFSSFSILILFDQVI